MLHGRYFEYWKVGLVVVLNRAPGQVGNRLTIEGNQNIRNNRNQTRGRVFNVNPVDALQNLKFVTGTFYLYNHFATVLLNSKADFSFISTIFVPLLNVKPSIVRPGYVIEVADGKKVEVDRIIYGCKLELGNSLFNINLIPLGHGSFVVIVGMDWLSKHKVEIVCHENVVRIPLASDEVLRVQGERALETSTSLKSTKLDEQELDDIPIIRDFSELKFNSIKDAKKLLQAIEKRFSGNVATRKTQRNLLKQQYEKFTALSSEMLDKSFDRLQKLVSQLELLNEKLLQEDVNQKLLRSLSHEWNTHAVVWRNKADLDTMSMDDLYNNLKVYEPEVKGMSSSINTVDGFSTASTQVNVAYSTNINNLSDVVICAFIASQPNSPQLVHEDLQQIHPDDIEEMNLRWKMVMLTIRAKRFLKNTRRKLTINGNETIGFDKSKVECYNCHKRGQFARECRALINQDNKNKESLRMSSDQAEEGPNYALIAFSSLSSDLEIVDNCKKGLGYENYNLVPPPYTRNFMPPTLYSSFTNLDKFVNDPIVENYKAMSSEKEPKVVRKYDDGSSIEEWVSNDGEEDVSHPKIEKKRVRPSIVKIEFVKSKQQEKTTRKTVKQVEQHRQNTYKAGSTACYVQNKVLVVKPHNKIPHELFHGRTPTLSFMRPFGCPVTILNTIDHLGKFNGKADEGSRPDWLFDIDALTRTMNYEPMVLQEDNVNSINNVNPVVNVNTVSSIVNVVGTNKVNDVGGKISVELPFDLKMHALEDDSIFDFLGDDEDDGAVADINNLDTTIQFSHILTTRIHKDHPLDQVIGDLQSATQTRKMSKNLENMGFKEGKLTKPYSSKGTKMSSKRELTFLLGLQVKQKKDGIFISQDKYVAKILKKIRFIKFKTASTPLELQKPLLKDEDGEEVYVHMYRSMIGSLMYLISSRPDIMFAVCACARYQVNLKVSHLHIVKRIFRLDRKSTTVGCQFFGCRLISWQCNK
nr:hypothetical protein [Tanacetum cinerariifolium]